MKIAITPRWLENEEGDFIVVKGKYFPFFAKFGHSIHLIPYVLNDIRESIIECELVMLAGGYKNYTKEIAEYEREVIKIAIEHKKPIYGICCGMWSINSYFGGSLKNITGHEGRIDSSVHEANIIDLFRKAKVAINSYHTKTIDVIGKGLRPFIISSDNEIEGFYSYNILGIQFHLENEGCSSSLMWDILKHIKWMGENH